MSLIKIIIEFKDLIVLCKKNTKRNKFKKEYNSSFFVERFFLDDMRSFEVNFVDELLRMLRVWVYHWKTFRTNLLAQKKSDNTITQRDVCTKLIQDGLLKDIYPQLSFAVEKFHVAFLLFLSSFN